MKRFVKNCLIFLFLSCQHNEKFNKTGWVYRDDLGSYPNRQKMVTDLTKNYKLVGLSCKELKDLLGEPESYISNDSNTYCYDIDVRYGNDIGPVYLKVLKFNFNTHSTILSFRIEENF